jgi:hypothetical protein
VGGEGEWGLVRKNRGNYVMLEGGLGGGSQCLAGWCDMYLKLIFGFGYINRLGWSLESVPRKVAGSNPELLMQ